jgi:hypothetical protein
MRKALSLLVLSVVLELVAAARGGAQHVDADPTKDYAVTEGAGPWMVLVATYTGPDRASLAKQMAYKIRADFNMPAYVYVYVDEERRRQREELDRANELAERMMRESGAIPTSLPRRTIRVNEQYGVLIGGWADPDAANAYNLVKIRTIPNEKLPQLYSAHGATTTDTYVEMVKDDKGRPILDASGQLQLRRLPVNPFSTTIVTRNPLIKASAASKVDPALKKFNADEEYSLLNLPHDFKYTLLVKEYIGATSVERVSSGKEGGFLSTLWNGGQKPGETLAAAARDAHELARWLRHLNFDAYVLHGRTSSIVTIGKFSESNDPGAVRVAQQYVQLRQKMVASDPLKLLPTAPMIEIPRAE